jgi:hypothetical protein
VPNVEDRLPLLIQKQLKAVIQRHPPLFPWETELEDYETTEAESGNPNLIDLQVSSPQLDRDVPAAFVDSEAKADPKQTEMPRQR